MPPSEPLISVIMGVRYRRENLDLLERSIQSILDQTLKNFELLICEWDSTAAAKAQLKHFAAEDKRIRLIDGTGADTLAAKLNRCLQQATGQYIARMDDDDYSHPERFAKQVIYLKNHAEIAFVGCNVSLVRDDVCVGTRIFPARPIVRDFYMTQPYIHPALMFRREALAAVGGYSEDKHQARCEDYDLLLRLYAKGYQGSNLQELLLDYTLPADAKGNRKMRHRWNEVVTRYRRFQELGSLPKALPWVVKPIAVGLLPGCLLDRLKRMRGG